MVARVMLQGLTFALCAIVVAEAMSHGATVSGALNCTNDLPTFKNCTKNVTLVTSWSGIQYCKYIQETYDCFPKSCCDSEAEKKALGVAVDAVLGPAGMIGCNDVGLKQCGLAVKNETNSGCTAVLGTFKDCAFKADLQDKTNASQICTYMKAIYKCFPKPCCDSTPERAALATLQAPYKSYLDMSNCILNLDCTSGAGLLWRSVASCLLAAVAALVFSY